MTARAARAGRERSRRPLVLVFGENENDRRAIIRLVCGLRPDLAGRVEERRKPLVMIKDALPQTARKNAVHIAGLTRQETAQRDVLAVLAHQDCDRVEPAHVAIAEKIEREIADAGCPSPAIGVTPAWEIEAWWMIFPEAVGKVVKGWRDPDDWLGKDVGQVADAKQKLTKAVQPRPKSKTPPRDYEEHDSIAIAATVADDGLLQSFEDGHRATQHPSGAKRMTRSGSFDRFRSKVLSIRAPG